jgi:GTP-binding protein EngB required for normal cell division
MSTMPHATEEQGPAEDDGLAGLVTADSRQLLDLINQLRDLGVNKWVELPKIIVVGDQNSGKSSVLEAISRLTFPSSDGLCTTFATRLTLLREAKKAPMVRIEPSRSHSPEIQDQLRSYIPPETSTADFASVVLDAKKYIIDTVGKKKDSFLEDELIIETSSPDFPPVTLVDLPGIIQTANEEQQDEDVRIVKKMVTAHMKEEKSIILAVISAQYGVAIQQVLGLAKELDPQGERTLGIITKPDILREGSEPHDQFLRIAANQVPKYHLSLGWHVVRNLDSESRKTGVDRDTEERKWLDEHPAWENTVGVGNAGIETLRNRLAGLLEEHTRRSLPEVINAIREHLDKCRADLQKLGDSRETPDEQRRYLTTVSEQFKRLVELANDGVYHRDKFFEIRKDASGRIRASVQTMNKQFAHVMRSYGHNMQLPETASIIYLGAPAYFLGALKPPEIVGREKCVAKVNELNANSTGKELDGMPNVEVVRELFRFKAKTWQQLAEIHLHEVWSLVRIILSSMIRHVANESTAQRIFRNIINEELDRKKLNMATRLQEILAPHLRCHPISYNPALKDRVQLLKEKPGGESYPELSTLQQVDAYYQVCHCDHLVFYFTNAARSRWTHSLIMSPYWS